MLGRPEGFSTSSRRPVEVMAGRLDRAAGSAGKGGTRRRAVQDCLEKGATVSPWDGGQRPQEGFSGRPTREAGGRRAKRPPKGTGGRRRGGRDEGQPVGQEGGGGRPGGRYSKKRPQQGRPLRRRARVAQEGRHWLVNVG